MTREVRRAALKQAYDYLYVDVSRLIREADPIGLVAIGAPSDEYDVEVSTILPRLRSATSAGDVQRIIHEEFSRWFGAYSAGPQGLYAHVAEEIWKLRQQSEAEQRWNRRRWQPSSRDRDAQGT